MTKRVISLLAVLAASWVPILAIPGMVPTAATHVELANVGHLFVVSQHVLLLYVWAPLVALSACVLLLSPGLLLAPTLRSVSGIGEWLVYALALSLVVVSGAAAVVQSVSGNTLRGEAFALLVVACALLSGARLLWHSVRERVRSWPLDQPGATFIIVMYAGAAYLVLVTLAPKFYWENFNGDGAHAFESARLLLVAALPFWSTSAGNIAGFPGMTSMLFAFPTSWFIRLFGEVEVAARLPYLLYLVGVHGVIVALAETMRARPLRPVEHAVLWLQLAVYTVVMAFSASYSPYSADIALPATQDTLTLVCFLAFVLTFIREERLWCAFFLLLTYVSLPNGLLLVAFWWLAVWLVWRPRPWNALLSTAAALAGCTLASLLAARMLPLLGAAAPGSEYGTRELIVRFAFLQVSDLRRVAFVAVPCGIVPALALLLWPRQAKVARALTLVTIAYFGFFYVQAFVALHHFVPAMLVPLAVFWGSDLVGTPARGLMLISSAAAAVIALVLSLPSQAVIDTSARVVGSAIEDRFSGYDRSDPAVFRRSELLHKLFPPGWDPSVPERNYGGSELVWNYYAHRTVGPRTAVNYILQPVTDPAPDTATLLGVDGDAALFVRSQNVWAAHRDLRPATATGSQVYVMPREMLFGTGSPADGPAIISLPALASRLGLPVDRLIERFGGRRPKG